MTISVNIYRNPLSPECREQRGVMPPMTLRQLTIDANGGASEWPFPTIAIVNGESWKRGRWNEPLSDGTVVEFRSVLRGGAANTAKTKVNNAWNNARSDPWGFARNAFSLYYGGGYGVLNQLYYKSYAGAAIGAYALKKLNPGAVDSVFGSMPDTPTFPTALEGESGSPSYGVDRGNRKRLGEPIPVIYGKMRVFPDELEDMLVYHSGGPTESVTIASTFCIGHGTFDTSDDDPRFGEAEAGTGITISYATNRNSLASGHVKSITSPSGATVTDDYNDAISQFTVTQSSGYSQASYDVAFTSGLFDATSGSIANRSVTLWVKVAEYNGVTLVDSNEASTTITDATRLGIGTLVSVAIDWTPTVGNVVKVYIKRSAAESTDFNIVEKCVVSACYITRPKYTTSGYTVGYWLDNVGGEKGSTASGGFSIVVTRKLSAYDTGTGTWGTAAATRSIAWALADILKNADYGMGLSDSQIDLDGLAALDTIWDGRGDYFDGVFDQTVTAWEALQKVARVGRAVPVLVNGKVTFVRDGVQTVRAAIFNPSNILPGSLSINYAFRQDSEPDGIDLTYVDEDTWTEQHVIVAVPGVVGDPTNPQRVDLFGCTDADQATREATYMARRLVYMRKVVSWQTEMDGRLLTVGDMVALSHDVPAWAQSGEVIQIDYPGGNLECKSSQPLDWSAVGTKYVLLKKPDGSVSGPHAATQAGSDGFVIADPGWTPNATLEDGERTTFVLYVGSSLDVVITDITPSGDTTHTITAVPYDSRIHDTGA